MAKGGIEVGFERALFATRWLMAPMYLGLGVALALLVIVFARKLFYCKLFYYLPRALAG
jgi:uncharacterized membrane protein YqhA